MTSEALFHNCKSCKETVLKSAEKCPKCGAKQKKDVPVMKYIGIAFLAWIIIAMINRPANVSTPKNDTKDDVRKNLAFDFSWGTDGLGMLMKANFTIRNNSDHAIKDIQIKCEHYANSGTKIDKNTQVVYEVVEAHSKRSFRDFDMGFIRDQVRSSSCAIDDFNIVQ